MVNLVSLIIMILGLWIPLQAQDVRISADVEQTVQPGQPVKGLLTIVHPADQRIDPLSVRLQDEPLTIQLQREEPLSAGVGGVLSIYSFELPAQAKGLHVLPEISVIVNGQVYRSVASTYVIEDMPLRPPPQAAAKPSSDGAELILEAQAVGPQPLYPGQRMRFVYRYLYSGNVELSKEILPLLSTEDFAKVGERTLRDYTEGGRSVAEVSQEVEAKKAGEFVIGPSILEGYAFQLDVLGRKAYQPHPLHAEAPPVSIIVKEFPIQGKPISFNGAVGHQLTFQVILSSKANVFVGDPIELAISITGTGDLHSILLPELCCQPGFSGQFKLGDLPLVGTIKGDKKSFQTTLRPLTDRLQAIPSIEFSYFDPSIESYVVLHSDPIPLTVMPLSTPPLEDHLPAPKDEKQELPSMQPKAIEIAGNYALQTSDLRNLWLSSWWEILLLPLACGALFLQRMVKQEMERRRDLAPIKSAHELFEEALQHPLHPATFMRLLTEAFSKRLVERGDISQPFKHAEELSEIGLTGQVKTFLQSIEHQRFKGKELFINEAIVSQATQLFAHLKEAAKND